MDIVGRNGYCGSLTDNSGSVMDIVGLQWT